MAAHSDISFKRLPVKIIGTGSYVPERRLTNADLEKMVDTSHEWIIERTGIVERRIAAPDEYTSHMGTKAAQRALESCGLKPEDIDLIIVATITPDTFTPSTSCYIQDALGAKNAAAFDISAACSICTGNVRRVVLHQVVDGTRQILQSLLCLWREQLKRQKSLVFHLF